MSRNRYKKGSWNVIDDVTGFKEKAGDLKERWDGIRTTKENWEPRHPQDFIKAVKDDMSVPYVRPRTPDIFVNNPGALAQSVVNEAPLNGSEYNGQKIL